MDPERRGRPVLHLLLRVRLALILRWLVVPEVLLTPEERKVRQGGRRRVRRLGCQRLGRGEPANLEEEYRSRKANIHARGAAAEAAHGWSGTRSSTGAATSSVSR